MSADAAFYIEWEIFLLFKILKIRNGICFAIYSIVKILFVSLDKM